MQHKATIRLYRAAKEHRRGVGLVIGQRQVDLLQQLRQHDAGRLVDNHPHGTLLTVFA